MMLRKILAGVVLIGGGLHADIQECDVLMSRPDVTKSQLEKPCLEAAQTREKQGRLGSASWYYLLAGHNRYNREGIFPKMHEENYANLGHSFVLDGNFTAAKRCYQTFMGFADPQGIEKDIANDYALLGHLYPDKKARLKQGRKLIEAIRHQTFANMTMVQELNTRFRELQVSNDVKGQLALMQKALPLFRKKMGTFTPAVETIYLDIGACYNTLGDLPKSLDAKRKALAIAERIYPKNAPELAHLYGDLGVAYQSIGNDNKALSYFFQALKIREANPEEHPLELLSDGASYDEILSNLYANIGRSYASHGMEKETKKYLGKALKLAKKTDNKFFQAYIYTIFGLLYTHQKFHGKAIHYYKKALKLREQYAPDDTSGLLQSYAALSEAYAFLNKGKQSAAYAEKSLALIHQGEQKGMPYAYALLDTVPAYLRIGKTKEAYANAQKAFDLFMQARDENFLLLDAVDKEHFLRSSSRFIIYLIEAEQAYGGEYADRIATLNAWLRYKGSIFDSENILSIAFRNTRNEALRQKMERLSEIKRSLAALYQNKQMPPKEKTKHIHELQREGIRISGELTQKIDALKLLHQYQSITGETVAESLESDELYVDFAQVAENYVVFVASPDKIFRMRFIPVKTATRITKTIFAVKAKLDNGDEPAKKDLSYLYDTLIGKTLDDVTSFKGKTNLVLSPDGPLHLIPFEMLYDVKKKRYLVQERNLRYVPNAKELLRLKARKEENAGQDIVLFDHPDFNIPDGVTPSVEGNTTRALKLRIAFAPLPGTKKEAEAIKAIMKDRPITEYADVNATEKNLLAIHHPKILHLSTHGFFSEHASPPNPMLRSHIALAGANYAYTTGKGNGLVSALKLSGLDLKGTDLVVLSACQTGVIDPEATDSISGLSKAFIEAGAKDVVVSLWSVSDMGTMMLMKYFYQEIHDGQGYAEALRNAKLKMIKKGAPVSIWAPFILNGV